LACGCNGEAKDILKVVYVELVLLDTVVPCNLFRWFYMQDRCRWKYMLLSLPGVLEHVPISRSTANANLFSNHTTDISNDGRMQGTTQQDICSPFESDYGSRYAQWQHIFIRWSAAWSSCRNENFVHCWCFLYRRQMKRQRGETC
jgi:hypothetical protein